MILTYKNGRIVNYIGRNGMGKQVGIEVLSDTTLVTLCPVNTKGVANCMLEIPIDDLPELIAALQAVKK